ncbi:2,3-diaminopropionate biosynthesis protein SbnB [[Flexibacter] sp. ATCC 35208]|uniref:2,3-diaminopropionate biosynthesis protein SbnB n=1 Tax=[Flexibacter] sp. ATCC 35208 TaxID=1936242 RepID=UPI0009C2650A|nr:2,3-diaminopropionate biosynthesis protein SbnB [[Flexibacter] sp. ATCC 35208]AQX14455.1 SbnB [[Flexibacter] sp. ATCC 35208]OMP77240.1 2,3-diaminopropionate biosynthesis protein SbnB [[Flexibacter] sp. ATCC 35208]
MLYLNRKALEYLGINWHEQLSVIRNTLHILKEKNVAQPIKPYLRYRDMANRIIAMPAYVGGDISMAGIKWIASFPGNIEKGLMRAHAVTILNEADTGLPLCVCNTALISGIRTAAVSGVLLDAYLQQRSSQQAFRVGITGFGPIGQLHLQMLAAVAGDRQLNIRIFDLKGVDERRIPDALQGQVTVVDSWEKAYEDADIFMTCTVSKKPYVNLPPKPGSLQLNVSLRDYTAAYRKWVQLMIVDDWEEVCRENTDIENMHREAGLEEKDTVTLTSVICDNLLQHIMPSDVIMFNPMGMAIFDIAVGSYYYHLGMKKQAGVLLED